MSSDREKWERCDVKANKQKLIHSFTHSGCRFATLFFSFTFLFSFLFSLLVFPVWLSVPFARQCWHKAHTHRHRHKQTHTHTDVPRHYGESEKRSISKEEEEKKEWEKEGKKGKRKRIKHFCRVSLCLRLNDREIRSRFKCTCALLWLYKLAFVLHKKHANRWNNGQWWEGHTEKRTRVCMQAHACAYSHSLTQSLTWLTKILNTITS